MKEEVQEDMNDRHQWSQPQTASSTTITVVRNPVSVNEIKE